MNFYSGMRSEVVLGRRPGKYGRNKPHPRSTHPRVMLENHMSVSVLPTPPVAIDWASEVDVWPIYYNDQLGDCTCAAVGHQIQAWTAYANALVTVPDESILDLYEAMGYVPGNPSTDNGAVIQDVLQFMSAEGIPSLPEFPQQKYSAFAEIENYDDMTTIYQALDLFGSVYLGINCPQSAETQFSAGEPWYYDPTSPIAGGHAIVLQKTMTPSTYQDQSLSMAIVTWGALQPMTLEFYQNYVEEAWVVVSDEDWLNAKSQETPGGLDVAGLMTDFQAIQGS